MRLPSDPTPRFGRCDPPSKQDCVPNVQVTDSKPGLVSLMLCLQAERKRASTMAKIRVQGKRARHGKASAAKLREKRQAERDARGQHER